MLNTLLALAGLAFASFTDLRERIVPDELSYSMVAVGLLYHAYLSATTWSPHPFLLSLGGAAAAFGFAYLLWRIGAWAGGDVKLFAGLGALVPWEFPFVVFLNSVALSFPFILLYVLARTAAVPRLRRVFGSMLMRGVTRGVRLALVGLVLASLGNPALTDAGAVAVFASALFVALFWEAASYGRREALRKRVPLSRLEEGMISADTLYLEKGKILEFRPSLLQKLTLFEPKRTVASMYRAAGLEKRDIATLRRHGIKSLWVKESMPMVPVMFLGGVAAALYGNLVLLLVELL